MIRSSRPPPAAAATTRWSSAPDRVAIVVNGNAKQVTNDLVETLDQIVQSGDLFVSRSLDEGRDIARSIAERGYRTVLTGGGDGTFVQMVSWIMRECDALGRTPPRFGLLKLGTGNALAWVLGAQNQKGRGVVADLARLRSEGGSRPMRLLESEDMLTPFGGLGADAIALDHYVHTKEAMQRFTLTKRLAAGPASYAIAIGTRVVPQFLFGSVLKVRVINNGAPAFRLGPDGQPVGRPIQHAETIYEGNYRLLAFSTIPYWGFGARVFPYAQEREDRFHLRIVNHGSLKIVANLRSIWRGTYRDPEVYDFLVDRMVVHCDEPTPVQLGGDVIGSRTRLDVALSERPIQVVDYYSPPTAVG